jgi:hypothetical protein
MLNPEFAYNHYKKHILNINDVDIFIHSWSIDSQDVMNSLYKPCKSVFEKQEHFNRSGSYIKTEIFGVESRVNSILRCLHLVQEAEHEHQVKYDYVMISRFDVAFLTDFHFSAIPANRLVLSHWNDRGHKNNITRGVYDLWFVGNTDILYTYFTNCNLDYTISEGAHTFWRLILNKLRVNPYYHLYVGTEYELVRRLYYDGHGKINTRHYRYPTVNESLLHYDSNYV